MTLLIACLLVYGFGLPWWMYVVAVVVGFAQLSWDGPSTSVVVDRLYQSLEARLRRMEATLEEVQGEAQRAREAATALEDAAIKRRMDDIYGG